MVWSAIFISLPNWQLKEKTNSSYDFFCWTQPGLGKGSGPDWVWVGLGEWEPFLILCPPAPGKTQMIKHTREKRIKSDY